MNKKSNNFKQLYLCTVFEGIYHLKTYDEDGLVLTDLTHPKKDYFLKDLLNEGWKITSQSQIYNPNRHLLEMFLILEKYE